MSGELGTTNLLVGIMAAASVVNTLVIIGLGVALVIAYRRIAVLVTGIEARHVAPAALRVNAILDDVKIVTASVKDQTARVDHAMSAAVEWIDDAADRVRTSARARVNPVVACVRGLCAAIDWFQARR
jgi:hypothetical protein